MQTGYYLVKFYNHKGNYILRWDGTKWVSFPGEKLPDDEIESSTQIEVGLAQHKETYQQEVGRWLVECFGVTIAKDKAERNHRFLEESLELVQSTGCTKEEVLLLVDYVYGRPVGEPIQEIGGTLVTLAALCYAQGLDMQLAGNVELKRIWGKMEQIRAKQATKPHSSPLPGLPEASKNIGE